ncbi:MAG TPA: UDP-N-acetylmuramoyl-L-alanyl-D-glutamate--2,6-diaminopimelate ligase [Elusimicrobiota bacterium]|nr:UDP-N-acetylmuramoyl-L-alanyl-D-glutamate--2,6-diaminopimelate ligase [Elusimicrobiota bacterium]
MMLAELLRASAPKRTAGHVDVPVEGLRHDSREVEPGDLFFALPGSKTDGNRHAREALAKGAVAVVSELEPPPPPATLPGAWIQVADAAEAMGKYADAFFRHPSGSMIVVGVTGTNGKTTTTYLLESIVNAAKGKAGVAGTIEYRLAGERIAKAVNTTPISLEVARLLARFRDGGASHALMEVSSHALALKRVETIDFDAGIFLNLTRDHLDFHKTTEAYFEAKGRLFDLLAKTENKKSPKVAALNYDDPLAHHLKKKAVGCEVIAFGMTDAAKDLRGRIISSDLNGSTFTIDWKGKHYDGSVRLPGRYNVSNALAAAAAMLGLGTPPETVLAGLASLRSVPGRLEAVDEGQDFHVLVDFAHTDSALEAVLSTIKALPHRRILAVFGCGGDRDKTKRGPMGVAACRGADRAFLTSDNPRSEDPMAIIGDAETGIRAAGLQNYTIEADRGAAIAAAIAEARAGDVVLIAGKGHEDYQILRDRTVPFDDRETARAALRALRGT